VCLTFGPVNGPEDFSYVVDRTFAPGRDAKRRFCTEWLGYVDDLTVRTGRVLDGVVYTDDQVDERLKEAILRARERRGGQLPAEALDALGFHAKELGAEVPLKNAAGKRPKKRKYDPVECDRNHPFAHEAKAARLAAAQGTALRRRSRPRARRTSFPRGQWIQGFLLCFSRLLCSVSSCCHSINHSIPKPLWLRASRHAGLSQVAAGTGAAPRACVGAMGGSYGRGRRQQRSSEEARVELISRAMVRSWLLVWAPFGAAILNLT